MPGAAPAISRGLVGAWFGLGVLVTTAVIASVNQQIIVLVTDPLKRSMALSDTQIGAMNGIALTLVSAMAVFPMGWLADRINRLVLLSVCCIAWSLSTIAFALSTTFGGLFVCAMGIAIGEAVLGPLTYTLIPDMFPREMWLKANFVNFFAGRLGGSLGLAASGAVVGFAAANHGALPSLLSSLDPWRAALICSTFAAPVLVVAILSIPLLNRQTIVAVGDSRSNGVLAYFGAHKRSLAGVFLGFGIVFAINGGSMIWTPPALGRAFGAHPGAIGIALGSVTAVAALLGILLAFVLVRWLKPRYGDVTPMVVAQIGAAGLIATIPMLAIAPTLVFAYGVLAVKALFVTACLSVSPAILQFIAPAQMRGRVIALGGLVSVVFMSASPLVIGLVSDEFFHGPRRLLWAIALVGVPCSIGGLLLLRFGAKSLPATILAAADELADLPRAENNA